MTRVAVGIPVYEDPEGLLATLASLRDHTSGDVTTVLLPDGPDPATAAALTELNGLPQFGTAEPLGAPACFNRLVTATDAQVHVLLESGARVGPGWLDHLLEALAADPRHGLAGPSTNASWNEQQAFPRAGTSPAEVARTAIEAALRFGRSWRTLEPLYSLGDFCYAVRREVVETVGPADEGYGLGPCWEMDYNVRAARAGFQGVWAGASYVARSPFTARGGARSRSGSRRASGAIRTSSAAPGSAAKNPTTAPTAGATPARTSRPGPPSRPAYN